MPPEYNIKISQLDPFPSSPRTEDFFPLVESSSMTTYRATLQDIGMLATHSIYADTASMSPYSQVALSASWASHSYSSDVSVSASWASASISASYAFTASWALNIPTVVSTSWASRSLQGWYSTHSLDVDTFGAQLNFPYWTSQTPGNGNANLAQESPLVFYPYPVDFGLVTFDSASTNLSYIYPYPNHRPDWQQWWFGDRANVPWGQAGNSGIQTLWPITSHTFIGTDQHDWLYNTSSNPGPFISNSYFSGSPGDATSGSFYSIHDAPGSLASIFNGKWVRLAAQSQNHMFAGDEFPGGHPLADRAAMGEYWQNEDYRMFGLVSLQLTTPFELPAGSNAWNQVDFYVHQGQWGGGISVTVLHVNQYGPQLIRAIRLHTSKPDTDPSMCIDILIDGLYKGGEYDGGLGEPQLNIKAQSWQGIRFLKWVNVDPWPFQRHWK